MSLSIEDSEARRLAAIERRKDRASAEDPPAIATRAAAHLQGPYAEHADLLYGDDGLPK